MVLLLQHLEPETGIDSASSGDTLRALVQLWVSAAAAQKSC